MSTEGNPKRNGKLSAASRFIHGRGRASRGIKRPYFYWRKRSTLTIPSAIPQDESSSTLPLPSNSFQRSEFFTAPVFAAEQQFPIIPIVNPTQYPGWRLYFPTETLIESSPMVTQIKAFEDHITKHPLSYILQHIRKQQWFYVYEEVLINDSEFQSSWINFSQQLQETPNLVLSCLGLAMHRVITIMAIESAASLDNDFRSDQYRSRKIHIRKINPRPVNFFTVTSICDIRPESYDRLLVVQGRVECTTAGETKCTWVAYKCKRCGYEQAIRQGDYYPTKPLRCRIQCNAKRNFKEVRSSPYTKVDCMQRLQLHETGLQCDLESFNLIDIEVRDDLVDIVCPGSDIIVTGVLKMKSLDVSRNLQLPKGTKHSAYIQAMSIVKNPSSGNLPHRKQTQKDLEIVQMITREPNCLRLLVQSLAPEVCGHEMAKVAVLLSLFGGAGSQLHDEGELHVLLVGDPGLGKSNLLENAANISEKGKLVSRKSSTNLMATIQQIKMPIGSNAGYFIDTGSILASHAGHCCIDDMDKLSSNQESLIHIIQAKSITARSSSVVFNAGLRTSVLAAVNPSCVHYDASKLLRENVRLSPSLLSLFHLIFVLFDKADKDRDNMLAEHVKSLHSGMKTVLSIPPKYSMELKPNDYIPKNEDIELDERLKVECDEQLDLLPKALLKKYIAYARQAIKPLLTKCAADEIKDFYLGLRSEKNDEERFSITTRYFVFLYFVFNFKTTKTKRESQLILKKIVQHTEVKHTLVSQETFAEFYGDNRPDITNVN